MFILNRLHVLILAYLVVSLQTGSAVTVLSELGHLPREVAVAVGLGGAGSAAAPSRAPCSTSRSVTYLPGKSVRVAMSLTECLMLIGE